MHTDLTVRRHRKPTSPTPAAQAAASTAGGFSSARVAAQDVASSRNAREAGAKVWTLWRSAEGTPVVTTLARLLVRL